MFIGSIIETVLNSVLDGDLSTNNNQIAYSTNIREVVSIADMIEFNKTLEGVGK